MMPRNTTDPIRMKVGELLRAGDDNRYLIPRYQRNYSWGEKEIFQLIRDVEDYRSGKPGSDYYIGTLVVHLRDDGHYDGHYETIDGQQRLTTLSILMAYLNRAFPESYASYGMPVVRFESRPQSDRAFAMLFRKDREVHDDGSSIHDGYRLVEAGLRNGHREGGMKAAEFKEWCALFASYLLEHVVIFRVEVPPDTDLNHYFEAMNSRGEQLEKHEVLKANLMSHLNKEDMGAFGKVWEACSNMDKYLQMSFDTSSRVGLFGEEWDVFEPEDFGAIRNTLGMAGHSTDGGRSATGDANANPSLTQILCAGLVKADDPVKEDPPDQFHSVIDFPNFLIHVLTVHTRQEGIRLDDKDLITLFEEHLLKSDPRASVESFAHTLLRARFLFDQFVIKRDLRGGKSEWSLLRLKENLSSSSYVHAFGANEEGEMEQDNRRLLMLQASLHVSNPSMSYKYWLLGALRLLVDSTADGRTLPAGYLSGLENMARRLTFDVYLSDADDLAGVTSEAGLAKQGVTPVDVDSDLLRYGGIRNNLLFNFLDYLLWLGNPEKVFHRKSENRKFKVRDFRFTPRSSVEHHSPQNPDGKPSPWGVNVHAFGNLYLISHGKNSILSNFKANTKRDEFLDAPNADSLKQQFMIESPEEWTPDLMLQHQTKMVGLLVRAAEDRPPYRADRFEVPETPPTLTTPPRSP